MAEKDKANANDNSSVNNSFCRIVGYLPLALDHLYLSYLSLNRTLWHTTDINHTFKKMFFFYK